MNLVIEFHLVERIEIMDQIWWTVLRFDMKNRHVFVMAGEIIEVSPVPGLV